MYRLSAFQTKRSTYLCIFLPPFVLSFNFSYIKFYYTIQTHVCIYSFEDIFAFLLVKSAITSFIFVKLFLRQSLQNTTYIILCIAEESFSSAYIPHPIFHFSFIRIHANTLIINSLELLINLITIQLYSQPLYNI